MIREKFERNYNRNSPWDNEDNEMRNSKANLKIISEINLTFPSFTQWHSCLFLFFFWTFFSSRDGKSLQNFIWKFNKRTFTCIRNRTDLHLDSCVSDMIYKKPGITVVKLWLACALWQDVVSNKKCKAISFFFVLGSFAIVKVWYEQLCIKHEPIFTKQVDEKGLSWLTFPAGIASVFQILP